MKLMNLLDTDPLALGAIAGLVVTIVVSLALFYFIVFHKDSKRG